MAELKTSYPGGKAGSGVYQTLINQIPPHDVYVSATAGHDAVLRYKVPAARNVAIDLDPEPLEWWSRDREDVELHNCDGIEWLRMNFGFYRLPDPDANSGGSRSTPSTPTQSGATPADADKKSGSAASRVFALVDPPYPAAVRTSGKIYKFDQLGHEFHARMLETVKRLPIMVMVCCYPNEYYDTELSDWRSQDYFSVCRSGEKRRERIWMNYPEPIELHDYRFLGKDRRERERIKRQQATLRKKIANLPPRERAAFLAVARENQG